MPLYEIRYAPYAWRLLNGCFCVYKPNNRGFGATRTSIIRKLVNELNSMECRPPREIVDIEGQLADQNGLTVKTKPSFSDHPLVVGQRYQEQDFSLSLVNNPGYYASGIVIGFIGKKAYMANEFRNGQHLKVYEIKGKFGFGTDNCRDDGKIVTKSRFKHIDYGLLGRVVSKLEATHQSQMFKTIGVDIRTEEAYEMASKGLIRPAVKKTPPIVYEMRITRFDLPEFTIEVNCINEFEPFLCRLIAEIGYHLRSSAMCTGLRLIRYGPFTVEHSLLFKHLTLENIIQNIKICQPLLQPNIVTPISANLTNHKMSSNHDNFLETLNEKH